VFLQSLKIIQGHNLELNLNKCILEHLNLKIETHKFELKLIPQQKKPHIIWIEFIFVLEFC